MSRTRNVKDLMSTHVMTVADDMTTDDLARHLIEDEISGAPVVDSQGHLVGVVSMTNVGRNVVEPAERASSGASGFYRDEAADLTLEDLGQRYVEDRAVTVRDVMTSGVRHVPVTASVGEVARLMVEQHIHRVVVTQRKEPVGCAVCQIHRLAFRDRRAHIVEQELLCEPGVERRNRHAGPDPAGSDDPHACHVRRGMSVRRSRSVL